MTKNLTNKTKPCIICGSNGFKKLYPVQDFNQNVKGTWDLVECQSCKLAWITPLPTTKIISSFYDNSFYTSDKKRFSNSVEYTRKLLSHIRVRLVKKHIQPSGNFLDFGSGPGHFGSTLSSLGWTVFNEDIAYDSKGGLVMKDDAPILNYPDAYFDAVSLWYVIEHMSNPRKTLQEIYRVLKPGGTLILAQQDFSSLQAKSFGPNWLILDPPRHLYQFSPMNLLTLSSQEGFQKMGISHHSIELGPFTILQSLLNATIGNANYLFKFLKNKNLQMGSSDQNKYRKERLLGGLSLSLSVFLLPVVFIAYYLLLLSNSGDVFTLFLRKK